MILQTSSEQRTSDSAYVTSGGDIRDLIMSAGTALAEFAAGIAENSYPQPRASSQDGIQSGGIVIVCGAGNNGCDGLAAAYVLKTKGFITKVYDVSLRKGPASPARAHFENQLREEAKIEIKSAFNDSTETLADSFKEDISSAALVLDCVFGSGFDVSRPLPAGISAVFDEINGCAAKVISADVPSGVSADTGETVLRPVNADYTVAFQHAKPGHYILSGKRFCGNVFVANIGMPSGLDLVSGTREAFTPEDLESVRKLLPERDPYGHKYSNGRVLVIAGSKRYCGAAVLAVSSALRGGAGLVTAAVPGSIADALTIACPEAVRFSLGDASSEVLTESHVPAILAEASRSDVIVIGPGLGRDERTLEAVRTILSSSEIRKAVVDADALFAISPLGGLHGKGAGKLFENKAVILTPHEAEAARLLGTDVKTVSEHRLSCASEISLKSGAVTVLKGSGTVTLSSSEMFTVNATGNSSLSKGGSGDVLSGLAGSLLARTDDPYEAARAAVFIHGLAAERLSEEYSEFCVLPSDLPVAFSEILC